MADGNSYLSTETPPFSLRRHSFPMPASGKCLHSRLAGRLVAMGGRAVLLRTVNKRPLPRRFIWKARRFEDTADDQSVLAKAAPGLRLNEHLEHPDGELVFAHACKMGLEGIVSKRKFSTYRSGRSPDWLKFKNPACEAVRREAEEDWG